jgi:hypothetical protein
MCSSMYIHRFACMYMYVLVYTNTCLHIYVYTMKTCMYIPACLGIYQILTSPSQAAGGLQRRHSHRLNKVRTVVSYCYYLATQINSAVVYRPNLCVCLLNRASFSHCDSQGSARATRRHAVPMHCYPMHQVMTSLIKLAGSLATGKYGCRSQQVQREVEDAALIVLPSAV